MRSGSGAPWTARQTPPSMPAPCCRMAFRSMVPLELRAQLAGSARRLFAEALTEKLMMYAVNRQLEYFDMPQVRAIVREAAKNNYKFSSIVLGIVNSDAFRKQGPAADLEIAFERALSARLWWPGIREYQETTCSSQRNIFPAERS